MQVFQNDDQLRQVPQIFALAELPVKSGENII